MIDDHHDEPKLLEFLVHSQKLTAFLNEHVSLVEMFDKLRHLRIFVACWRYKSCQRAAKIHCIEPCERGSWESGGRLWVCKQCSDPTIHQWFFFTMIRLIGPFAFTKTWWLLPTSWTHPYLAAVSCVFELVETITCNSPPSKFHQSLTSQHDEGLVNISASCQARAHLFPLAVPLNHQTCSSLESGALCMFSFSPTASAWSCWHDILQSVAKI